LRSDPRAWPVITLSVTEPRFITTSAGLIGLTGPAPHSRCEICRMSITTHRPAGVDNEAAPPRSRLGGRPPCRSAGTESRRLYAARWPLVAERELGRAGWIPHWVF